MAGIQRTIQKGIRYLRARGLGKTIRKTALHLDRKRLERRFARRTVPPADALEAQRGTAFPQQIRFSVAVPLYCTPMKLLREMVDSVQRQSYENWELCLADGSDEAHPEVGDFCRERAAEDSRIRYRKLERNAGISGNTNAALEMATGEYIALLDHDDLLTPNALFEMAKTISETGADFLYSDELIFASGKARRIVGIRFKPDFAPEDLLTNNYICHLTVFRRELMDRAGRFRPEYDGSQDHDMILRLTAAAERVEHIPKVLYLWRSVAGSVAADVHMKEYAIDAGRRAVESFLRGGGREDARVESTEVFPTMYRIREPISGSPSVRILVNAAGEEEAERLLQGLRKRTAWENCRWQALGEGPEHSAGSRRRRIAEAAENAGEDYLVFVDGISEALTPEWIQEMLMLAQREEIGEVGAKVRFAGGPDLRHAGVILGLGREGIAGRPYFDREDDLVGFFGQLAVVRNVTAVTDCWMIQRKKWADAGGFDPRYECALADIDLCLKLRAKGFRNLWTPYACLAGGRAKDYRLDVGGEHPEYARDKAVFRERWAAALEAGDPYYNPNLSLKHEDWRIRG